jgi:hypothetical protein
MPLLDPAFSFNPIKLQLMCVITLDLNIVDCTALNSFMNKEFMIVYVFLAFLLINRDHTSMNYLRISIASCSTLLLCWIVDCVSRCQFTSFSYQTTCVISFKEFLPSSRISPIYFQAKECSRME